MALQPLHILLDADGTLFDWGARWDEIVNDKFSHLPNIPRTKDQRSFNLKLNLTEEESAAVDEIFNHPGFYGDLKPIEGSQEAVAKMQERGHHVQIATSPWWENPTCLQDKSDSIANYFGTSLRKSAIFTGDKTTLRADYLFDDKPEITGNYTPVWKQILFDQPYNKQIDLPRIITWDEWEEKLEVLEEQTYSHWDVLSL